LHAEWENIGFEKKNISGYYFLEYIKEQHRNLRISDAD
jgi:hypothetical protein